jgi:hypothetical protein
MAKKVRKFMNGELSPVEAHRKFAWNGRRCECGIPAAVRIKTFMHAKEFARQANPGVLAAILAESKGKMPTLPTTYGPMVRIGDAFACTMHSKDLEVAAAKLPDYVLVEIDRGPKDIPIMVGATGK